VTLVVDNSEQGHEQLPALAARHGAELLKAGNRGGLAGAYNTALDRLRAQHAGLIDQVVFLDDDSDPAPLNTFLRDPLVGQRLQDVRTAAVAPAYRDRATGLRGKYIELGRFRLNYLSRQFSDLRAGGVRDQLDVGLAHGCARPCSGGSTRPGRRPCRHRVLLAGPRL
jgi:hypothetical protein